MFYFLLPEYGIYKTAIAEINIIRILSKYDIFKDGKLSENEMLNFNPSLLKSLEGYSFFDKYKKIYNNQL